MAQLWLIGAGKIAAALIVSLWQIGNSARSGRDGRPEQGCQSSRSQVTCTLIWKLSSPLAIGTAALADSATAFIM